LLFHTTEFLVFFVAVRLLYAVLPWRWQNLMLLAASYLFYGYADWRFVFLLAATTTVDWALGLAMGRVPLRKKRLLVTFSVCLNLGVLAFFKLSGLFSMAALQLSGRLGLDPGWTVLSIALPAGVSFYTFQSLGYVIDVYRGQIEPCRSLPTFALYVSFFPQLIAGPIERASHILPQLTRTRRVTATMWVEGLLLMLIGLVRKFCISDVVAPMVDLAFGDPSGQSSLVLFRGVFLFSIQAYGDFAGYSDMARGLGKMLGIELMVNFRHPYASTSLREFWRRWHISLSTWLRDYLYIPLGGSRHGERATRRNVLLTMLISGMWHGATWNFICFGGLHGVGLVVARIWSTCPLARLCGRLARFRLGRRALSLSGWFLSMSVVFGLLTFFRARDLGVVEQVVWGILELRGAFEVGLLAMPALVLALLLLIDVPQYLADDQVVFLRWHWALQGAFYATMALALLLLRVPERVPFLYFQF